MAKEKNGVSFGDNAQVNNLQTGDGATNSSSADTSNIVRHETSMQHTNTSTNGDVASTSPVARLAIGGIIVSALVSLAGSLSGFLTFSDVLSFLKFLK